MLSLLKTWIYICCFYFVSYTDRFVDSTKESFTPFTTTKVFPSSPNPNKVFFFFFGKKTPTKLRWFSGLCLEIERNVCYKGEQSEMFHVVHVMRILIYRIDKHFRFIKFM